MEKEKINRTAENKIEKIAFFFLFFVLFLLLALRWNSGTDTWHTYTPEYLAMKAETTELNEQEKLIILDCAKLNYRLDHGASLENTEQITYDKAIKSFTSSYRHTAIGFQALERALLFFGADMQWLYVVTSAFILIFILAAIEKQTSAWLLALAMFVLTGNYFLSMNVVTQYMAISVCLFACTFAQERKPIPFFCLVAFAACFHISALVFLLVYFLPKLNIKPLWCAIAVVAMLIIAQFCWPLLEKLVEAVAPAYARYFGQSTEFEWIFFAIGIAVFIVGTYYYPKGKDKPYYRLWYYANIIGLIALCFSGHIPYMKRINYYFAAPHFLFLPLVIQCEEKPGWRKAMTVVMIALFIAETIIATGILNKNGILPYHFFFDGDRAEMTSSLLLHIPGLW